MSQSQLTFTPLQPNIGAEVGGIDFRENISAETAEALRAGWRKYKVLVFRDQNLTREQHMAMARIFGTPEAHPVLSVEGHPEIVPIAHKPDAKTGLRRLQVWHADVTYLPAPPSGALLRGITIPALGGDTGFVNTVCAYQRLDEETKKRIRGMKAVHQPDFSYIVDSEERAALESDAPPFEHPVVIVHPTTGEPCLYVNEHFTRSIVGLSEGESRELLVKLFHHLAHVEFQMRVKWRAGTLVLWDERATQHYAITDYDEERYLERILVAGTTPRGLEATA